MCQRQITNSVCSNQPYTKALIKIQFLVPAKEKEITNCFLNVDGDSLSPRQFVNKMLVS